MIKYNAYKDSGEVVAIDIPTQWAEVKWSLYLRLINEDDGTIERRVSILTGIELNQVLNLNVEDVVNLIPIISFTFDFTDLEEAKKTPEKYKDWYIGHQSWAKLEEAKQVLAKLEGKDPLNAAADIVRIYDGTDINDKPVTEVLGLAAFFLRSYINFISVLLN